MIDYYEGSAESIYSVPLKVSEEEARTIASDIVRNSGLENEDIYSDYHEALVVFSKDDGLHISSDVYGYTRLDAYEDFILPFLKACANPEKPWAISVLSNCTYGISQGLHVHCDSKTDRWIDSQDVLRFIYDLLEQNLLFIDSDGQFKIRNTPIRTPLQSSVIHFEEGACL